MFKILVIITASGGYDGGRAIGMQTLEFDNKLTADLAAAKLASKIVTDMIVIQLY